MRKVTMPRRLEVCLSILLCASPLYGQLSESKPSDQQNAPLKLVRTLSLPSAIQGHFDHFGVDLKHHRLFATPEDFKAVLVFDLNTGEMVHQIDGLVRPHAVLYREDLNRIYVTDGGDGTLKIYDGDTYDLRKSIQLLKDADSIGYDPSRRYLYIDNGGGAVGQTYSMLSVVDTTKEDKIADIQIGGDTLEAMTLDSYRPRLYVNDKAKNQVVVVDRWKNTIVASWPVTLAKDNVAMALDEPHQRLFVGCRSGQIVVFDTNTGKELLALPISKGIDDLIYDLSSKRLYSAGDGAVDAFDQVDADHYNPLGSVPSGPAGKTGRLVPELNRLFVAVPSETHEARILTYKAVNVPAPTAPVSEPKTVVDAPMAEQLIMSTLSAHPYLRKMGLHVIPPGQQVSILIANGNATRLGIRTTDGDFTAVKEGKTYGPKIDNGSFYNMKLSMFDASDRRIGILVMEIPSTSATDQADAIRQAEAIRKEVAQKIPDLQSLFLPSAPVR
jgi:hypothetical protein